MADLAHATEHDTDLHGDPDATHWAERLVHHAATLGIRIDEGMMLAWFASAIETGAMVERAKILAELGEDHFVTFADEGATWFMEHSAQCRLSGAMASGECEYHQALTLAFMPPESGRWKVTGIHEGLPDLELVSDPG